MENYIFCFIKQLIYKSLIFLIMLLFFIFSNQTQAIGKPLNLKLFMNFNGSTIDEVTTKNLINFNSNSNVEINYTHGRLGDENSAISISNGTAIVDFALENEELSQTTITMWIKSNTSTYPYSDIINMSHDKKSNKGVGINNGVIYMDCGRDGSLNGPNIVFNEWTFIACVYDYESEEARLVVNDTVYKKMAKTDFNDSNTFRLNISSIVLDELRIYNKNLSINELETIYGQSIKNNSQEYPIINRFEDNGDFDTKKMEWIDDQKSIFINGKNAYSFSHNTSGEEFGYVLKKGDKFNVIQVDKSKSKENVIIMASNKQMYYMDTQSIYSETYKENESYFSKLSRFYIDIQDIKTYIMLFVLLLLSLLTMYINKADGLFKKFPLSSVFSLHIDENKNHKLINIMPSILLGLTMTIFILFREKDLIWFFSKGISIIPKSNYDRICHWIMYIITMVILLILLYHIIYSIFHFGPLGGILRFIIILFGNIVTSLFVLIFSLIFILVSLLIIAILIFISVVTTTSTRYYYVE